MPGVLKLCNVCGTDVADKKRVKDQQGRYYCEPCYANLRQGKQPSEAAPAKAKAAARSQPVAVAAAPAPDDGMMELAPVRDFAPVEKEEMFGCSQCKKLVPKRQIRNEDGEFICAPCISKRNQAARGTPGKAAPSRAAASDASGERGFSDSLFGGILFTLASLAVVFGAVAGLQFVLPLPAIDESHFLGDTSSALAIGAVYSFWHFGFALVTWLAVLIAVKTGKGNGATLGATLWKSFTLCGGITCFFRITDQWFLGSVFGLIPWLFFIIRYTALDVGLASMFGFSGFPRRAVALVGMLFSEFMGLLFYALLGVFVATGALHHDGKGLRGAGKVTQQSEDPDELDEPASQTAPAASRPAPAAATAATQPDAVAK